VQDNAFPFLAKAIKEKGFLVRFEGFLDPASYAVGKKITVLGEVAGKKVLPLKEMDYSYPVLLPREHYLWKPEDFYGGSSFHIGIGVGGSHTMTGKLWIVLLMTGLMVSCAPLSREIMSQVDKTLAYQVVHQDPERYMGKIVL
jgi:hypothetical protein